MLLKDNVLYEFEEFILDASERTLWRENETVSVTPKAIETLCLLVENHGKLLSKDDLINALWADTFVEERNLAQNIFTLRKVLGETGKGKKFIETVPRRGYRFVAEVRPVDLEEEFIEVSLAKRTTIKAEGNVSSRDLTEAVKETAKSLALDRKIEEKRINQVKNIEKQSPYHRFGAIQLLFIGVLSLLLIGNLYWFRGTAGNENARNSFAGSSFADIGIERLTDSGKAWNPSISPDEQQIAYVYHDSNKDSIRLQNLATGSVAEPVAPRETADYGRIIFSNDGNYLFYSDRDGGKESAIFQTPIYGGYSRKIVENVRSDFSLSPDGERLAFFRYDGKTDQMNLVICRTDGSGQKVIKSRKGAEQFIVWEAYPSWSPDGKKIVAAAITHSANDAGEKREQYFVEIDVASGKETRLPSPEFHRTRLAIWMPDGKSLIALAQQKPESPFQIWKISYPDGAAKSLTNDLISYFQLSLSPKGDFLLTDERNTFYNIWLIDAEIPSRLKQLTFNSNVENGYYGLDWTPDAKRIIYSRNEGVAVSNIWSIDVETQKTTQLTTDKGKSNWFPVVTPDGSSIIFSSNRTGKPHLWQMNADGSDLRQITDGVGECYSEVSPDGNWLIYATPGYVPRYLWKKPLRGEGKAVKIADFAGGPTHVSPASNLIAVHSYAPDKDGTSAWRYIIMSMEGGAPLYETALDPERAVARWKTDGSGFYYPDKERDYNNIWFYSLNEKKSTKITNFDHLKIVNMSVSPDGKQFAVSRGAITSEIIKISGFN